MAGKFLSKAFQAWSPSKLSWWHKKARWPTNARPWAKIGHILPWFSHQSKCRWPWLPRHAPVAFTWQTKGMRKTDWWPAGVWKSRGESPPALVCVWFSEMSKQIFIPGLQAPCLSTSALGQNLPAAGQGQTAPLLNHTRTQLLLSFLSSTNQCFLQDKLWLFFTFYI